MSEDDSQEFWHEVTALPLIKLLQSSGYSNEDIETHTKWYTGFILPALGRRPQTDKKPLFNARITADGSPVELSVNFKETSVARTVRFTIEAIGPEAGTLTDPYNQDETTRLLQAMTKSIPSVHLGQYDTFTQGLFLAASTAPSLLPKVPAGAPLSQAWVAFDLAHGGGIMVKVYFMPFLKWLHTASSSTVATKDLVFDIARGCNGPYGSYDHPIALLDAYLGSFSAGSSEPTVEMVAIDCIDSPSARIKCYLRTGVASLQGAKEVMTLGGRIKTDDTELTLQLLGELWAVLFRSKIAFGEDIETKSVLNGEAYCHLAVEMKPGFPGSIETKLHIPVNKVGGGGLSDEVICAGLGEWFAKRGHEGFGGGYRKELSETFDKLQGTHTFVSFTYTKKTGVYMSMYYSPQAYAGLELNGGAAERDVWEGYDDLVRRVGGGVQEGSLRDKSD
ncbi:aromatic prenyltransferase [Triangularia verruculosa]|uniref:Aromatic prenyltransferase n=1 Tax=Triangularia verruculosa TaxID=2587418 RepID=A0AAN6XPW4_9PEZI|nr:aromatic prenyltransferase [Triangularia verruculosa]